MPHFWNLIKPSLSRLAKIREMRITRLAKNSTPYSPTFGHAKVVARSTLPGGYYRFEIEEPTLISRVNCGQFVMLSLPDGDEQRMILPRPMAIHRINETRGTFEVIFKVVGSGTKQLSKIKIEEDFYVLGPLGNGFEIADSIKDLLLIGRGIGICSIATVAQVAQRKGISSTAVLSSRQKLECIAIEDFKEFGSHVITVADDEGSSEVSKVEDLLLERYLSTKPDTIMVCGSNRLMGLAVKLGEAWQIPVQASMEAHMACGLGYCHGCSLTPASTTNVESPLVCVDGPVFKLSESFKIGM